MQLEKLHNFLCAHRLAVLSTTAPDGSPQSALIGFAVAPNLNIVFDTLRSSRKYANLKASPRISFVIGWNSEVTVQYEGIVTEPEGEDLQRAQEIYFRTWPEGIQHKRWPGITWFLVKPTWVRFSDFENGQIEERTFPPEGL